ncbi:hypothetical protein GpartN1_g5640.t1 [Galdieria partita]|uniref:Coatomer subunit alpha n=1 Tax=Galdieria partita TaxID=83374 RepID=A0A9C7Q119_9RHOD|nr:hypothetical protein GpartN1_g5640.t1 [Galdieria partita]
MLTKFETKSNRVKGLSFHPIRPWILASLHNGVIQLWDYRMGTLLDRFEEHEGPVRGIHFHPSQPLFVSGGDDYKIKVWNYKLRRCLFTLLGHLDYIRTVFFHHESPWIVSASDDQTIRIWNWQNRSCIAVLTGHNHYVMSAVFHPDEDLLLSASLDQTIRIWDISGLRNRSPTSSFSSKDSFTADIFSSNEAFVRNVIESHFRGVNWASFHPTIPLIVSGGDDRQVKLTYLENGRTREIQTFYGHLNNVSCVMFHPSTSLIVSNSEDRTIRVWDPIRHTCLQTYRRENDRFWILAVHPKLNLIAAGHDSGMIVFKLDRERPPFYSVGKDLYYVKEGDVRLFDLEQGSDQSLYQLYVKPDIMSLLYSNSEYMVGSEVRGPIYEPPPRYMHVNTFENCILLTHDRDSPKYSLYFLGKKGRSTSAETIHGFGVAVFVGRNRFATLSTGEQLQVRDLRNEITKTISCPIPGAELVFPSRPGTILISNGEVVVLFDMTQRKILKELGCVHVKYVVWNEHMNRVALLSKHSITLASGKLEHLAVVHETVRVKSAVWDDSGVLLYTTLNHLKYCLPNGDTGIVRTLDTLIYLTRARGPAVAYLDREGNPGVLAVDPTEYAFKLLLLRKKYDEVQHLIAENRFDGQAMISYLCRKGFPEVALEFVRDDKTRFHLALEAGLLQVAVEAAQSLDTFEIWRKLGEEALAQGNVSIAELAYQRSKDLNKLIFLYIVTGNFDKLEKAGKLAEMRQDYMAQFLISFYLGDVNMRTQLLYSSGQMMMAMLYADTYQLSEWKPKLASLSTELQYDRPMKTGLLLPAIPVYPKTCSWPLLEWSNATSGGYSLFRRNPNALESFEEPTVTDYYEDALVAAEEEEESWIDHRSKERKEMTADTLKTFETSQTLLDDIAKSTNSNIFTNQPLETPAEKKEDTWEEEGWEEEDVHIDTQEEDIEFPNSDDHKNEEDQQQDWLNEPVSLRSDKLHSIATISGLQGMEYKTPEEKLSIRQVWSQMARSTSEYVVSGRLEEAIEMLKTELGFVSFEPLKSLLMDLYITSCSCVSMLPSLDSVPIYMLDGSQRRNTPKPYYRFEQMEKLIATAEQRMTAGKFSEAFSLYRQLIITLPFVIVDDDSQCSLCMEMLTTCREYIVGLMIRTKQAEAKSKGDTGRQLELAALMTHCNMLITHQQLALQAAMKLAYATKNYLYALTFAKRLLELAPSEEMENTAKKVMHFCERNPNNQNQLEYDVEQSNLTIDAGRLKPCMQPPTKSCVYCGACYDDSWQSMTCVVCQVAQVMELQDENRNAYAGLISLLHKTQISSTNRKF